MKRRRRGDEETLMGRGMGHGFWTQRVKEKNNGEEKEEEED